MIKLNVVILFGLTFLSFPALAQMKPTTKNECHRRCLSLDFETNPKTIQYKENLRKIQEKKKMETDPEKLKKLNQEEERENENREDFLEKMCTFICRNQPDD